MSLDENNARFSSRMRRNPPLIQGLRPHLKNTKDISNIHKTLRKTPKNQKWREKMARFRSRMHQTLLLIQGLRPRTITPKTSRTFTKIPENSRKFQKTREKMAHFRSTRLPVTSLPVTSGDVISAPRDCDVISGPCDFRWRHFRLHLSSTWKILTRMHPYTT